MPFTFTITAIIFTKIGYHYFYKYSVLAYTLYLIPRDNYVISFTKRKNTLITRKYKRAYLSAFYIYLNIANIAKIFSVAKIDNAFF